MVLISTRHRQSLEVYKTSALAKPLWGYGGPRADLLSTLGSFQLTYGSDKQQRPPEQLILPRQAIRSYLPSVLLHHGVILSLPMKVRQEVMNA